MTNSRPLSCTLLVVLGALGASAHGQSLTSRFSQQNFNSTYGGGSSVFTPSGNVTDTALVSSDSEFQQFSDSKNGFINNDSARPWSASIALEQTHNYTVSGQLSSFSSISASGQTFVAAAAGGEGLATIFSSNPGNTLELYFSVGTAIPARLRGNVDLNPNGQNLAAFVALQKFDGIVWQNTFNSLFLPGQEGAFDNNYTLTAGSYRIVGLSGGNAFAGVRPSQTNTWNYTLAVVPEPGSMVALGLGLTVLLRRKKKSI